MTVFSAPASLLCDTIVDFTVITPEDVWLFEEDFGDTLSDAPYWSDADRSLDESLLFDPHAYARKHAVEAALARARQDAARAPEPPEEYWQLRAQLMRLVVALSNTTTPEEDPPMSRTALRITIDTRSRRAGLQPEPPLPTTPPDPASASPSMDWSPLHDTLEDAVHYAESIIGEFQDHYQRFDHALDRPETASTPSRPLSR